VLAALPLLSLRQPKIGSTYVDYSQGGRFHALAIGLSPDGHTRFGFEIPAGDVARRGSVNGALTGKYGTFGGREAMVELTPAI